MNLVVLKIPGQDECTLENIVFDYNGTLAVDGVIDKKIKSRLTKLAEHFNVYILTADTYGTVTDQCKNLNVTVKTFPKENAGLEKRKIIQGLNGDKTIAVGNGFNDIKMLKESRLTFAVIEKEGCCGQLIYHADIVVNSILDVLDALENPARIKATLRN